MRPNAVRARPVEVPREPPTREQHLQRREVEVGPLALPRVDDAVDFVDSAGIPPLSAQCAP